MCLSLFPGDGQGFPEYWAPTCRLRTAPLFTSAEVATCHWLLISKNTRKLAAKLVRRTRKIWMQTASAPIVPFKAAPCVTLCQAVGPVGRGGLSGILIGLALSVISGGALYCKTGLGAIDTIIERKKRKSAEIHTTYTGHVSSNTHRSYFRQGSCLRVLLQLMFYFADFYFSPHFVYDPLSHFFSFLFVTLNPRRSSCCPWIQN